MKRFLSLFLFAILFGSYAMAYDFSAVCSTGQTLYYNITSNVEPYTVKVTYPYHSIFQGDYYYNYTKPTGNLIIPSYTTNNGITYSITSIGNYAFYGCSGLTSVTIPSSVTNIDAYAYYGCSGLTSFTIPNSVISIGEKSFNGTGWYEAQSDGILYLDGWCLGYKGSNPTGFLNIADGTRQICNYAFSDIAGSSYICTGLTSVIIPNSVTSIGNYAFYECSGLTSVTIGNSVTSIGAWCFYSCNSISEINTLVNTPPSLGANAFSSNIYSTATVFTPCATAESYRNANGWSQFSNIQGDTTVNFTVGVQVQDDAMGSVTGSGTYSCEAEARLEAIANDGYHFVQWNDGNTDNPRMITVTSDTSFTASFGALRTITVALADETMGTVSGSGVYADGSQAIISATANEHYRFVQWNDGNNENPRTITVTEDATYIADFAIDQLVIVVSSANEAMGTVSGSGTYDYGSSRQISATPNEHYRFVQWNDGNNENPRTITVTEDATYIADFAIDQLVIVVSSANEAMGTVSGSGTYDYGSEIELSATPSENYNFVQWNDGNTDNPRTVIVTEDATYTALFDVQYTIAYNATEAVSGNWVASNTDTSRNTWDSNTGEGVLYLNPGVTAIGGGVSTNYSPFEGNNNLVSVDLDNSGLTSIGLLAFSNCVGLTSVTIPNSVTRIDHYAFFDCIGLRSVTIPNSVTSIGNYTFGGCENLETIVVETGNIFYDSRDNCNAIIETGTNTLILGCKNTIIPNFVISIGTWAFFGCHGLTSVAIPNSVTSIGEAAFSGCDGLTSVTIPNSVTSIGNEAFYCDNIVDIYANPTNPASCVDAFNNYSATLYVPCGTAEAYASANGWSNFSNINESRAYMLNVSSENPRQGIARITEQPNCTDGIAQIGATPNYSFRFVQWDDGVTDNPRTVIVTEGTTFTALFEELPQYTITVLSASNTRGTVSGGGTFYEGAEIQISATANEGYRFSAWNDGSTDNPRYITLTEDAIYIASFEAIPQYTITVLANNDAYGTVEGGGEYYEGEEIQIFATANEHFFFVKWSDESIVNPRRITVTADTTYTAIFEELPQYTITAISSNEVIGTVTGGGTYYIGDTATLEAIGNNGYAFLRWSDGNVNNPRRIRAVSNASYTAYFAISHIITVNSSDTTMGTVTDGGVYAEGTRVTLRATAKEGYKFLNWNDTISYSIHTFTVTEDAAFTANFVTIPRPRYTITALANNEEYGTVEGGGVYVEGAEVTLTPIPFEGYNFVGWEDGYNYSNLFGEFYEEYIYNYQYPRRIIATSDATYTAIFEPIPQYTITVFSSDEEQGTVTGGGTFRSGTNITIEATANEGYGFLRWDDGNTSNPRSFDVYGDATFTAFFGALHTITTASSDATMGSATGGGVYAEGANVTIRANANNGYRFTGWDDGETDNPRYITVTEDATYTAIFEEIPQYTITVLSENEEYGTVTGSGTYYENTDIYIIAYPNSGYRFTGWDDGNTDNPRYMYVTEDTTYTAIFEVWPQYTITVLANNEEYGTVTGGGTYYENNNVTIRANANSGYRFTGWDDGNTSNPRYITITEDATYTAIFEVWPQYTITVLANNDDYGTVEGSGTYYENNNVNIRAFANNGYRFIGWNDGSTTNPRSVRVTGDTTYTANFEPLPQYTITALANNDDYGTVEGSGTYIYGTTISLEATANEGYIFYKWDDNIRSNPRSFMVTANAEYTAIFVIAHTITVVSADETMGTTTGSGVYAEGSRTTLKAIANHGYRFLQWDDGNTNTIRGVIVSEDATYTAIFEAIPQYAITAVAENEDYGTVTGGGTYYEGDRATLSAYNKQGYRFVCWSDGNTSSSRNITVTSDSLFTASFTEMERVTIEVVSADLSMGEVLGGGTYQQGSQVTISATAYEWYGCRFLRWNDGNTDNPRTIIATPPNATYIAIFETIPVYTVSVVSSNEEHGTVTGGGMFMEGDEITISAEAAEGYVLTSWSDGNMQLTRNISVTEDATYTAYFADIDSATTFTITAIPNNNEFGTVTGGGVYAEGTVVTLTAAINDGDRFRFIGWDDGVTSNWRSITVTEDATFTAIFEEIPQYTVTVLSENEEYGAVTGGGTYYEGTFITIRATPLSGYLFSGWSDGDISNPRRITVTEDATYTAIFEEAQYILLNSNTNGSTITTCNTRLFDSGGPDGNYSDGENYTITFCGESDAPMIVDVIGLRTESVSCDYLKIYDGSSASGMPMATLGGSTMPLQTEYETSGNCVTIQWRSDYSVRYAGFELNIRCGFPCQGYTVEIEPQARYNAEDNAYLGCQETTISANLNFMHNNENYEQTIENTNFEWNVLDIYGTSRIFAGLGLNELTEPFEPGIYYISLKTTDANGCEAMSDTKTVYISVPPTFAGTALTSEICPGEAVELSGNIVVPNEWQVDLSQYRYNDIDESICFDDYHTNQEQYTCINIYMYPGQYIETEADIESIGMNMEHSYMGDLDIMVQCPNGQRITLFNKSCGGAFFGEPVDFDHDGRSCNDGPEWVGVGYDYYWTMENNRGLMRANCPSNGIPLPSGNYQPVQSFENLVGCPINGVWCVIFIDNLGLDDGTLFHTEINFADYLVPTIPDEGMISFQNTYSTEMWWEGEGIADSGYAANNIVTLAAPGDVEYTFYATDNFGCTYDTTLTVHVRNFEDSICNVEPTIYNITVLASNPNAGTVTGSGEYAENTAITITATANEGYSFDSWNDGNTDSVRTVRIIADATYIANFVANTVYETIYVSACDSYTWNDSIYTESGEYTQTFTASNTADSIVSLHLTLFPHPEPIITIDGVLDACHPEAGSVTLSTEEYDSYIWSNGETTNSIEVTEPNIYYVEVVDSIGCHGFSELAIVGYTNITTETPRIKLVGMSNSGKNVILWEVTSTADIAGYEVYREDNIANVYNCIARIERPNARTYIDQTSEPGSRAYRYKICSFDECGGRSPLSDFHKTMHLTINRGVGTNWNLIWSHYEGLEFNTYKIYRGTSPRDMVVIGEIPSTLNSFTDIWNTLEEGMYYRVEIVQNNSAKNEEISLSSNIVANEYVEEYTITALSNNVNLGSVYGSGTYPALLDITLAAIPNAGYDFVAWSDGSTENPRVINVTGDAIYVATFAESAPTPVETYTITAVSANPGYGTVTGGGTYPAGTVVTLTAEANEGYQFIQWNDDNIENPREITVSGDAMYIATFAPENDISEITAPEISIFPNPANDVLNIISSEIISEIEIVNVIGQIVLHLDVNADNAVCNIANLPTGLYEVRIYQSRASATLEQLVIHRKFIKE